MNKKKNNKKITTIIKNGKIIASTDLKSRTLFNYYLLYQIPQG